MEASGWPQEIHNPEISEEERQKLKQKYLEKARIHGVELDPNNIKPNPGMRTLAKLVLNSLWGR